MFDHHTLRVSDPAAASIAFTAVLDEPEIEQTMSTPSSSVWGNFALTQTDGEHPIERRVHIAFIATTPSVRPRGDRRLRNGGDCSGMNTLDDTVAAVLPTLAMVRSGG